MKKFIVTGFDEVRRTEDITSMRDVVTLFGDESMQVSDGYHTLDEVYEHRISLFIALCRALNEAHKPLFGTPDGYIWRSKAHHPEDTPMYNGWFVLGIGKEPGEQITYHLPLSRWEETDFSGTLDHAPKWDGHKPTDTLERLKML